MHIDKRAAEEDFSELNSGEFSYGTARKSFGTCVISPAIMRGDLRPDVIASVVRNGGRLSDTLDFTSMTDAINLIRFAFKDSSPGR